MDFIKKHYEKVLLGVVLAGLAVGAAMLPWMISNEKDALDAMELEITKRPVSPLPEPDLSQVTSLLERAAAPISLDFTSGNKLFNPVPWQRRADGTIGKVPSGEGIGVNAVVVTKITPLYTIITLDSVTPASPDTPERFHIGVEREAAATSRLRRKQTYYATLKAKNDVFTINEVKGPADAVQLVIQMNDTDERATLSKSSPYKREDGYMADLKYPPDNNRTWNNQRVGDRIPIAREYYNIVAITTNEVVLSAPSGKKTSRPYNPGP